MNLRHRELQTQFRQLLFIVGTAAKRRASAITITGRGKRMAHETRHFVAYHNTEKMGRSFAEGNPFRILTNKPVDRYADGIIWVIFGEGRNPRRFSLGSFFRVTEMGDAAEDGFNHFAAGQGEVFRPPIPLNDLEWFNDFKRAMNSFQFGIQPLKDEGHIAALTAIATRTVSSP
jgi:hypothetical protein